MKIDTGSSGSLGPWLAWTSNGSAMKGLRPMSWVLRGKDDNNQPFTQGIAAFEEGCIMDLDTLKLGWEKDGSQGQAPERKWNPSIEHALPRPDDSLKAGGGYAWGRALSVRVAMRGGHTATWEQGQYAAYASFEQLAAEIMAQFPGDGRLPLVVQNGTRTEQLKSGPTNIPILTIAEWVPRPDSLKDAAPNIAMGGQGHPPQQGGYAAPPPQQPPQGYHQGGYAPPAGHTPPPPPAAPPVPQNPSQEQSAPPAPPPASGIPEGASF